MNHESQLPTPTTTIRAPKRKRRVSELAEEVDEQAEQEEVAEEDLREQDEISTASEDDDAALLKSISPAITPTTSRNS